MSATGIAAAGLWGAGGRNAALLATVNPVPGSFSPDAKLVPGWNALMTMVNGIGGWALMLSLAGLVIGAAIWAIGAHAQNYQHSYAGRRAVLVSGLAALVIGAAPTLIDFFFHTGQGLSVPH